MGQRGAKLKKKIKSSRSKTWQLISRHQLYQKIKLLKLMQRIRYSKSSQIRTNCANTMILAQITGLDKKETRKALQLEIELYSHHKSTELIARRTRQRT